MARSTAAVGKHLLSYVNRNISPALYLNLAFLLLNMHKLHKMYFFEILV